MPRRPSPAVRTTLYRLKEVGDLTHAVQSKYLEDGEFTVTATSVGGRDALLVCGAMVTERVRWAEQLHDLTGQPAPVGNQTAAATLIIRDGAEGGWALAFGMGFQLLDLAHVDAGFGQRIAIRTASPAELSSMTKTVLDQRPRTDRLSIPGGEYLRGFGVGDFGDLVTRVVARAQIPGLTSGDTAFTVRGADALSAPLGRTPTALLSDLNLLSEILDRPPVPGLEILEQLVAIKKDAALVARLEARLADSLSAPGAPRLGLGWPQERIDEHGTPNSYRILGDRRPGPHDHVPTLDAIVAIVSGLPQDDRVDRLRRVKVQLFSDPAATPDSAVSSAIPALKWLAFEVDLDGRRYCLHDGGWYLMDQNYAARLRSRVQAIFDRPAPIALPDWPKDMDEQGYNELLGRQLGGTVLDRRLVYTEQHPRGIELCDVLAPGGELIHVKNLDSSAPASHLLAQALVSADSLRYDEEARAAFGQRVTEAGRSRASIPHRIHTVVLGAARTRPITADDLFTFTQVTLVRLDQLLEAMGIKVHITPILRG